MDGRTEQSRRWDLVLPHRDTLVRAAIGRGATPVDAEDCAQEAMLRAVEFADLDEDRVVRFLVATTVRLAVDRARLRERDRRLGAKLVGWSSYEPGPDEVVCDRAEASWLCEVVDDLPERHRAAVVARAEGRQVAEIAAQLSMPYKTVEGLLGRLRSRMRVARASALALVVPWLRRPRGQATVAFGAGAMALAGALVISHDPRWPGPSVLWPTTPPTVSVLTVDDDQSTGGGGAGVVPAAGGGALAPWPARSSDPVSVPTGGSGGPAPTGSPSPTWSDPGAVCVTPQPTGPIVCSPATPDASADPTTSPAEGVWNCIEYGVDPSPGFRCRHGSPSPPTS